MFSASARLSLSNSEIKKKKETHGVAQTVNNLHTVPETQTPKKGWHPTPACLPGESHGQRSLVCRSLWGHKEWDKTE